MMTFPAFDTPGIVWTPRFHASNVAIVSFVLIPGSLTASWWRSIIHIVGSTTAFCCSQASLARPARCCRVKLLASTIAVVHSWRPPGCQQTAMFCCRSVLSIPRVVTRCLFGGEGISNVGADNRERNCETRP